MADVLDHPTAKRPVRVAIDAKLRTRIEAAVEKLIAALDASEDVDQDTAVDDEAIDETETEPSLGSSDLLINQERWNGGRNCSADDGELDDSDFEPSLGSSNDTHGSGFQPWWGFADSTDDRESDGGEDVDP